MNEPFKVIVAGGRNYSDYATVERSLDRLLANKSYSITIVSGAATGADALGERYAESRGYEIKRFPADWNALGKAAGPIRNAEMARYADALVAFWDGKSRGTASMIDLAKKHGLAVRVVCY